MLSNHPTKEEAKVELRYILDPRYDKNTLRKEFNLD